jgi:hypothetical protein
MGLSIDWVSPFAQEQALPYQKFIAPGVPAEVVAIRINLPHHQEF